MSGNSNHKDDSPRSRQARLLRPARTNWRQKVKPDFFVLADVYRQANQLSAQPLGTREERKKHSILILRFLQNHGFKSKSARARFVVEAVVRHYLWMRYRKTPEELFKGLWGEKKAVYQYTEAVRFLEKWLNGRLHEEDFCFRTNEYHSTLILAGLPLGLGRLSEQELADCFDNICPCKREESHDGHTLRKIRDNIRRALENKPRPRFGSTWAKTLADSIMNDRSWRRPVSDAAEKPESR